jgi:hypothetical protein
MQASSSRSIGPGFATAATSDNRRLQSGEPRPNRVERHR